MRRWWWYVRLCFWHMYEWRWWTDPVGTWRHTWGQPDCWDTFWQDGTPPRDAVLEDMSYG